VLQLLKTEFDSARILYNRFVSAIAQKPTIATVLSPDVSTLAGGEWVGDGGTGHLLSCCGHKPQPSQGSALQQHGAGLSCPWQA